MTIHELHDALNLLPDDLLAATDRLRMAPRPKVIPWKSLLPVAASLLLILSAAMVLTHLPGAQKSDSAAPQAPAAAAPMEAADEKAEPQEAPAAEEPATGSAAVTGGDTKAENDGHLHRFAEDAQGETGTPGSWCGNIQATVTLDGREYTLSGDAAMQLTAILEKLPYDPALVCRCTAEFTVETETEETIEVSLSNAFARCSRGQASLTEEQAAMLEALIESIG